ncbi:hypothetical protein CAL14_13065 [Bordetella genomosp. 9]|nr:hypothetical protein CAL14_13065 [Bordetella genomosp. 9]
MRGFSLSRAAAGNRTRRFPRNLGPMSILRHLFIFAAAAATLLLAASQPWGLNTAVLLFLLAGMCAFFYAGERRRLRHSRLLHSISGHIRALAHGGPGPTPLPPGAETAEVADALEEARERFRMAQQETNARLESMQLELHLDPVTRLPNRKYFFNELRRALTTGARDGEEGGHVLMFRQRDLAAINRHMPRDFTDQWLRSVALRLDQKLGRRHAPPFLLARLNGSDFALLLPGVSAATADQVAHRLRQELHALRVSLGERSWCRWALAIAAYTRGDQASRLLASLDHGLMRAESADTDAPVHADVPARAEAAGELQWRDTLVMALEQHRFSLSTQALNGPDGKLIRNEGKLMLHDAEARAPIEAEDFMPPAIRLGLSTECDIQAVRLALDWLVSHAGMLAVSIAVPSLAQSNFLPRLGQMLRDRPGQAARLVLEVEARGLVQNFADVRHLCEVASEAGARVGMRRLAEDFSAMTRLHELPIAYLRLGADFLAGMARSPGSRQLATCVRDTAKALGIEVYADGDADAHAQAFLDGLGIATLRRAPEPLAA